MILSSSSSQIYNMKLVVQKSLLNLVTQKNLHVLQVQVKDFTCLLHHCPKCSRGTLSAFAYKHNSKSAILQYKLSVKLKLKSIAMGLFLKNKKLKGKGRWQLLRSGRYSSPKLNVSL